MTPSPTPHCRVPSASRCLSSSSRPSARSACSSQAAVCLRPGAARWSRSRPSSKLAGCPSGPSQGLGSKGPDHPGQAFALATDSHLQPGAAASLPSARMQNTFPRPDRQFTNYGLVGPSSGSLRCCNTSTETCRGSRQPSPRLSKGCAQGQGCQGTWRLVSHSYKGHFPFRATLKTENRAGGGKVALYRGIITSCCSDRLARGRTGSCTHKGLNTLGGTLDFQRPEYRTHSNLWIPLV